MDLLSEYGILWYHVAISLFLILMLLLFMKGVFRLLFILVVIAAVFFIGVGTYIKDIGGDSRTNAIRTDAITKLTLGAGSVKAEEKSDGSYTITRHGVILNGTKDSDKAKITIDGHTLDIQLTPEMQIWVKRQTSPQ
jgi:uncharacterized membrane protein YoaK (UPF0700 family)